MVISLLLYQTYALMWQLSCFLYDIVKEIILIQRRQKKTCTQVIIKGMSTTAFLIQQKNEEDSTYQKERQVFCILIIYNRVMQATSEQLHQVWLQSMQMNQCTPQAAIAFVNQVRPVLNVPLTSSGQTLLMLAASMSSINLVKAVLSCKPNVKMRDSIGRSPLHYTAAVGCIQIFQVLIKSGCDPLQQTIGGETSLSKACLFAQGSIIQWYLNNCLSAFQLPDCIGKKPLQLLRNSGQQLYQEAKQVYQELKGQMKE